MIVWLNDKQIETEKGASLLAALSLLETPPGSFAIAVNQIFVPKSNYATTRLQEGDRIELVMPMQGG